MDYLKSAFNFIAVLSVLVIVHEWGHFIVAKACRMRVDDFSLFFGPRIARLGVRNGTEYNIRAIPLGGFVKIAGMESDDMGAGAPLFSVGGKKAVVLRGITVEMLGGVTASHLSERVIEAAAGAVGSAGEMTPAGRLALEQLQRDPTLNDDEVKYITLLLNSTEYEVDSAAYNQKPLVQRAAVIAAGPFMSIALALILFAGVGVVSGLPEPDSVIETVVKGKPADRAGLRAGDRIVSINGSPVSDAIAMIDRIRRSAGQPLTIVARRDAREFQVTATPEATEVKDEAGKKVSIGRLGFAPGQHWRRYAIGPALVKGAEITGLSIKATLETVFSKHVSENVGGVISIGAQIHKDTKLGFRNVVLSAAMLSMSLGVLNLFPIPVLDGGHLLLLAWEGVRRRKLSTREMVTAQVIGLSIIGALFVLVMYKDITRLIHPH